MPRTVSVSGDVIIRGNPETVYDQVSDPRLMGQWSPENRGASLDGEWQGAARVGMVFAGHNERGAFRWTTQCEVTAADPGERFAFRVRAFGQKRFFIRTPIASWEYSFEAVDGGTRVTETWTDDRRWPDLVANTFDRLATRGKVFADYQQGNIRRTLDRLKEAMESGPAVQDGGTPQA